MWATRASTCSTSTTPTRCNQATSTTTGSTTVSNTRAPARPWPRCGPTGRPSATIRSSSGATGAARSTTHCRRSSSPGSAGARSSRSRTPGRRPSATSRSTTAAASPTPTASPTWPARASTAAWTLTGFQLGTIGDSGRGVCTGPSVVQVDLSLYKNVKLSNRVKAQLRFEVFNVFNRVNFLNTGFNNTFNPTSVTFDTGDPATATKITGYTLPGNFGQATATRDPRQAQVGIKLIF